MGFWPTASYMAEKLSVDSYLAAVLTYARDPIICVNNQDQIVCWNLAAERLFGYSQADVLGRHLEIIVPPTCRAELTAMVVALRSGDHGVCRELTCRRSDGSLLQMEMTMGAVWHHGRNIGVAAIARDLTERKSAEAALRNSERLAATGRLAASIAHEINNPLESVTNLLYLLERHGTLDETARHYVSLAGEELARIVHITRQTLGFYRESAAPVWISISEVVDNVLALYARRLQSRRVKVEKRFGSQPKIRGFPGEIRQVFANLIVNALEAVGEGGLVKLHIFESCDWKHSGRRGLRVLIADNGPGIAPEHRQRIFEPFYTTKGERGTGLGLWVSSGIIHKYGGDIRVHSSVHPRFRGTAFSVFLPVEPKEKHMLKAASALYPPSPGVRPQAES